MAAPQGSLLSGRIRSIKPEWLEDEKLAAASDEARLLSIGLLLIADDYGRGRAHPSFIASQVWAYSRESREGLGNLARASRAIAELAGLGFVKIYDVAGQRYFAVINWAKHQRVDHAGKPRVPGPQEGEPVELPPSPASPEEQAAPPSPASASAAAPPVAVEPVKAALAPAEPPTSAESTGPRDLFGEPVKAAPKRAAVKVEDPADVVFAAWLEGRALARVKSSHAPVLPAGDKRRAAVARIMSPKGGSFTLPQLQQAARGIWLNPWVLEDPSTRAAFGLVVRDAAHVENYLALAEAASTPAATPGYERRVVAPPPPRSPSPPPSASPPRPFAAPPVRTFAPPPSKSLPESA